MFQIPNLRKNIKNIKGFKIMKTIVLIGMPGVGKSTIGEALANETGLSFADIDNLIEKFAKKTISQIFETGGELYFRELEAKIIAENFEKYNIISLGGGAFENRLTQALLLANTNVIYLSASVSTLISRLQNEAHTRPLLESGHQVEKLAKLLQIRGINYKLAPFEIMTDNKVTGQVVKEILKCVNWK